jgi:hypothetical protein
MLDPIDSTTNPPFRHAERRDAYDEAVAYLKEHRDEIFGAWRDGFVTEELNPHHAHILFRPCGHRRWNADGQLCGCLTQVKNGMGVAATPELTEAIRLDQKVPEYGTQIRAHHLEAFADWQRRIDRELGRPAPKWKGVAVAA